ncbi:unnamed protein product [Durusdinium trenchii]|uniref:Uncharacterized protein n=2 Tax=Durusdinium trenchii TaxID=1381693 RepID=A0ABP0R3R6_9DINO
MVEIHIPKLGIHGRLEPGARVDGLDEDGLPEDLQLLKALEAQEKKAVEKLEDSNRQLDGFLAEEEDADFREAIEENLTVIERKLLRLEKIAVKILELTPPQPEAASGYVAPAVPTPTAEAPPPAGLDL